MALALPWIIAYVVLIALWAIVIARRDGPTLWKGSSLVALNTVFIIGITGYVLLRLSIAESTATSRDFPVALIVFDLLLVALAIAFRKTWLLIKADHAKSIATLQRCFVQTRATSSQREDAFVVQCAGTEMTVWIRPNVLGSSVWLSAHRVQFTGGGNSKKAALIRDLFSKQFHRSFPTPRIKA